MKRISVKIKLWHSLFFCYLWQCRLPVLMFFLFILIFTVVFSLYALEAEAVIYAACLCALTALPVFLWRFYRYCRAFQKRQHLLSDIELNFECPPPAQTLAERDYQHMLRALGQINQSHLTDWQQERKDTLNYYTAWVHQIKAPIAAMQMTLQSEDTALCRQLLAELFRIEQYVDMVLSYIRLGSSESDFVIREYALDPILRQAIRKYAPQFIRKKIKLHYSPVDVRVLTDEKWLLFILEQLLSNAVKYTPAGSVSISVSPQKLLSIADTGIGIADEDLPRIFEKGFTGYNGRADKKATGLGLYLSRQAARKLNIPITVQSEPGKGTTFTLDLHCDALALE